MQPPFLHMLAAALLRKPLPEDECEMRFCVQVQQGQSPSGLCRWKFRANSSTSLQAGDRRQNKRMCGCEPYIQQCGRKAPPAVAYFIAGIAVR